MTIEQVQATVFVGGGRRWFTRQAAANAEARAKIKTKCECYPNSYDEPGETCERHHPDRYQKLKRRLARLYIKASPESK